MDSDSASRALAGAAVVLLAAGGTAAAGLRATGPRRSLRRPPASTAAGPPADRTDPRTATAELTVPAIGVTDLRVVPYEGTTDDAPGTRIQDRGVAASPYGEDGGVGPGEIGNYLVTAHRLSAGGPFHDLPSLRKGDKVLDHGGRHGVRVPDHRRPG